MAMQVNQALTTIAQVARNHEVVPVVTEEGDQEIYSGAWTGPEQDYLDALCQDFHDGALAIPDRSTLRNYLAKMLGCLPKRISKRMENSDYKGRAFFKSRRHLMDPKDLETREAKLAALRKGFLASRHALNVSVNNSKNAATAKTSSKKSKSSQARKSFESANNPGYMPSSVAVSGPAISPVASVTPVPAPLAELVYRNSTQQQVDLAPSLAATLMQLTQSNNILPSFNTARFPNAGIDYSLSGLFRSSLNRVQTNVNPPHTALLADLLSAQRSPGVLPFTPQPPISRQTDLTLAALRPFLQR